MALANVIIDNGTGSMKAGYSSDDNPRAIFPTVVGRPKENEMLISAEAKDVFIGKEAQAKRGILNFSEPVMGGQISNWDDMIKIWSHCFHNELRIDSQDYNVMLTEAPKTPKTAREEMCKIMFEQFNVRGFYV